MATHSGTKVVSSNPTLNQLLSTPITGGKRRHASKRIMLNPSAVCEARTKPISYLEEIRKMMHGFGDVRNVNVQAARLIESIVQHQTVLAVLEAHAVAKRRQSKQIGVEDFLFLLRHDRHKLAKLVRYLRFKDMKLSVVSSAAAGGAGGSGKQAVSKSSLERLCRDAGQQPEPGSEEQSEEPEAAAAATSLESCKRTKLCQEFLRALDGPQHEMSRLLLETDLVDEITLARNRRLNELTQAMSVSEYLYYQSCRMVTFFGSSTGAHSIAPGTMRRFKDWVLHQPGNQPQLELSPSPLGWEVIQYLAHETVAILVELSLLVRDDLRRPCRSGRPLYNSTVECETMPSGSFRRRWASKPTKCDPAKSEHLNDPGLVSEVLRMTADKIQMQTRPPDTAEQAEPDQKRRLLLTPACSSNVEPCSGISTEHILEAMRRFESGHSVFSRFARCHGWAAARNGRSRILALR